MNCWRWQNSGMGTKSNSAGQKKWETIFIHMWTACHREFTSDRIYKIRCFFLTADSRRLTQTFLPADPAGKKYVNRCAIILFDCQYNFVALSNPVMTRYYLFSKNLFARRACRFSLARSAREKILSAHVCVCLAVKLESPLNPVGTFEKNIHRVSNIW